MKILFPPNQDFFLANPDVLHFFSPSPEVQAAFYLYHPDSPIFTLSISDKVEFVKEHLGELTIPIVHSHRERIEKYTFSLEQRALANWLKTLQEREEFFSSIPYALDTVDIKDAMLARTPKLWDAYEQVKARLTQASETTQEGTQESISEKGII